MKRIWIEKDAKEKEQYELGELISCFILAWGAWWLWNTTCPLPPITYWKAVVIYAVLRGIFK